MPDGNNLFKENKTLRDFSINLAWQLLSVFRFREIHSASGHRTNTRGKSKRRQINYQYKKTHINIREMGGGVGGANLKDFDGPISHCGVHLSIVLVAQVND